METALTNPQTVLKALEFIAQFNGELDSRGPSRRAPARALYWRFPPSGTTRNGD
jgi:hypothetical protein